MKCVYAKDLLKFQLPVTDNVILLENRVIADVIVEMRLCWYRMSLWSNMTDVLRRRGENTQTLRGQCHLITEAEI